MFDIRIIDESDYDKGKSFEHLCVIILSELGYHNFIPRKRVTGMEIDIECTSKLLEQKLIAECKAQEELIGSPDYTKFFGKFSIRRQKDRYLHGVFITTGDFNSEVKASYDENDEDTKKFFKILNKEDILLLLERSTLVKSMLIRENVKNHCGKEAVHESILWLHNKLYWASKIELSGQNAGVIIFNSNGEYLKDYELEEIKKGFKIL